MATAKAFMHSIEELLKQPDFIRSERLSAAILNSMGNDCQADREKLDQLVKALQFIAATASPATAPFLKLAFDKIERLSKRACRQIRGRPSATRNRNTGPQACKNHAL
jgi:hypothetical protein